MSKVLTQNSNMEKIEELRKKMLDAAKQYGMNHPIVLHYSQELDRAHNQMIEESNPALWGIQIKVNSLNKGTYLEEQGVSSYTSRNSD